ncbi:MAG: GAF domain-containing protein, partial [Methylocystaceae bacterium]
MNQIYQAAQIITSNLLYSQIRHKLASIISAENALLLTIKDDDLVVVEVTGQLPATLILPGCRPRLEELDKASFPGSIHPVLEPYQHRVCFQTNDGKTKGFYVYSGPEIENTTELEILTNQIAYLLDINNCFSSLPHLKDTEAKLNYQLSFFINTVNNIFEPYDSLTMVKLYMEIIAEMFLFPTAVVYELNGNNYIPIAVRGMSKSNWDHWVLEASPILAHPALGMFPQRLNSLNPDQLGVKNHQKLQASQASLLIPLQINDQPQYLISFHAQEDKCSQDQDWRVITALVQTFNRAIELNQIRQQLISTNQALDKQVFSLTTVYQAAEKILIIANQKQTASMALDMLMEIFQSVSSSVFIHNPAERRLELLVYKSVIDNTKLSYWLASPEEMPFSNNPIISYTNPEERRQFLELFPTFIEIEDHLQPHIIINLQHRNQYYGFITLSSRMTEQPFSVDDLALLLMLSHSIAIALDNAWMLNTIEEQNRLLDQRLEQFMAIQDTLRIMREATSLTEFCTLLENTLSLGVGAHLKALIIDNGQELLSIWGSNDLTDDLRHQLQSLSHALFIQSASGDSQEKQLVVPVFHPGRLKAYLIISEFTDTILEDGQRLILLDLIAAMLTDTMAHLYELYCVTKAGVPDYSLLLCHRLQEELNRLADLGLPTCIIKFQDQNPVSVINAMGHAATG